jgi:hypothetical protein
VSEDVIYAVGTGDDNAYCNLCNKTTSVVMIGHHLITEHGIDPEDIAFAEVVDLTDEEDER